MGPKTIDSQTKKSWCVGKIFHEPQNTKSFWPIIVDYIGLKISHKVAWVVDQMWPRNETIKFDFPMNLQKSRILVKFGFFCHLKAILGNVVGFSHPTKPKYHNHTLSDQIV